MPRSGDVRSHSALADSPDDWRRYQSSVWRIESYSPHRGTDSDGAAGLGDLERQQARLVGTVRAIAPLDLALAEDFVRDVMTSRTVADSSVRDQSCKHLPSAGSCHRHCASRRYPESGSSTCCQGRTADGRRTNSVSSAAQARIASGIKTIGRPVAAADDVAGTSRGDRHTLCSARNESR